MRTHALLMTLAAALATAWGGTPAAPHGHPGGGPPDSAQNVHEKIKDLQARCEADPKALEPRVQLGELCLKFGLPKLALKRLDEALAIQPDQPQTLGLAGMAHYQAGSDDEAIRCWSRLAEVDPKNALYRPWLERARRRKAVREDIARIEAQLRDSPADAKLHAQAGDLYGRLADWPKAVEALAKAVSLAPDDAATRKTYAIALFRAGKMDDALTQLEACAKLDPKNPDYPKLLDSLKRLRTMHQGMQKAHGQVPSHGTPQKGDSQK